MPNSIAPVTVESTKTISYNFAAICQSEEGYSRCVTDTHTKQNQNINICIFNTKTVYSVLSRINYSIKQLCCGTTNIRLKKLAK